MKINEVNKEDNINVETKICRKCGKELELDKFCKSKGNKDGLSSQCKECDKLRNKEYYKANKEAILKQSNDYYKNNRENVLENRKQHYEINKDVVLEQCHIYYEQNKDDILIKNKIYKDKNRDIIKIKNEKYSKEHRSILAEKSKQYRIIMKDDAHFKSRRVLESQLRRARKLALPATFTIKQWEECKTHFNNKCAYCNKELPLEQEHLLALTKGGSYTSYNIIPACKTCNCSKNDKDLNIWYPKQSFYDKDRETYILEYLESMKENSIEEEKILSII